MNMKKFILLVVIFIVATFFIIGNKKDQVKEKDQNREIGVNLEKQDERRAVFISYIELNEYIKDKDSETSKKNINFILKNMNDNNFNMVILHVRPFSDAIYPSKIFPISKTVLNDEKKAPTYDVLDYFITEAHKKQIEVHAWINPYRISNETNISDITQDHPAHKFLNTNHIKVIEGKGIFYNPASDEVKKLIIKGVKELVENYNIDGVHFDDYFYPDKTIDLDNYQIYLAAGGKMSLDEYRLENVSSLIKDVYSMIKSVNKDVEFGISPEGNIENNYSSNYIDTKKILKTEGYVDYIMPQIYFGFENESKPFLEVVKMWNDLIKIDDIKLLPALAFYKSGQTDKYAKSGKDEWINKTDIIKRQVLASRNVSKYDGFSLFRYDYIFSKDKQNNYLLEEFNNLLSIF